MTDDSLANEIASALRDIGRVRLIIDASRVSVVSADGLHAQADRVEAELLIAWRSHRWDPTPETRRRVTAAVAHWNALWLDRVP